MGGVALNTRINVYHACISNVFRCIGPSMQIQSDTGVLRPDTHTHTHTQFRYMYRVLIHGLIHCKYSSIHCKYMYSEADGRIQLDTRTDTREYTTNAVYHASLIRSLFYFLALLRVGRGSVEEEAP